MAPNPPSPQAGSLLPIVPLNGPPKITAKQERQELTEAIGRNVLHTLGRPTDRHWTQVRWLWENHYRVNVLVGANATSFRIAHSYFLVADPVGNLVESTPTITKQY